MFKKTLLLAVALFTVGTTSCFAAMTSDHVIFYNTTNKANGWQYNLIGIETRHVEVFSLSESTSLELSVKKIDPKAPPIRSMKINYNMVGFGFLGKDVFGKAIDYYATKEQCNTNYIKLYTSYKDYGAIISDWSSVSIQIAFDNAVYNIPIPGEVKK